MPHLLSLKMILADIPDFWNALNPSTYSNGAPSVFQNLKEVSLIGDDSDGHIFDAFSFVALFHLPNICTLYLGRIIAAAYPLLYLWIHKHQEFGVSVAKMA